MKSTYIFSITSKLGVNKLIIIDKIESIDEAIQKAKIETLSPLKGHQTDKSIIKLFHELEYSFNETVRVFGGSFEANVL